MDYQNPLGQPIGAPLDVTLPRSRPGRSPMTGRYCSVVALDSDAHSEALHSANLTDTDGRIWTYLPYGPFATAAEYRDWVISVATSEDPMFHAILDDQNRPVGVASYLRIDPSAGSIEVGHICYSPLLARKAAATEAMYLMMKRAFDEVGYRRYEWKCDALNAASQVAARRLGFTYEGTFRQATHYKGRNRDTAWYSVIDKDWPDLKARFKRWLDPANFDGSGHQMNRLER